MDLRYLTGRYACPLFVGLASASIAGAAFGFGLVHLLAWFDGRGTALMCLCAISSPLSAVLLYRRAGAAKRLTILHACTGLYFGLFGLICGGTPGAWLGHALAGDVGEMIGWFAATPIAVIAAVVWGWRYSHRLDPPPVATDEND